MTNGIVKELLQPKRKEKRKTFLHLSLTITSESKDYNMLCLLFTITINKGLTIVLTLKNGVDGASRYNISTM